MTTTTLARRMMRFPGGIPALAKAAGIAVSTAYEVAGHRHRRIPIAVLRLLAKPLRAKSIDLEAEWIAGRTLVRGDDPSPDAR